MAAEDKTEKIQVLLSSEDLEDLGKKISKNFGGTTYCGRDDANSQKHQRQVRGSSPR